jgi:gamma-glutamyltranspeptidase/glutathione hydrolase
MSSADPPCKEETPKELCVPKLISPHGMVATGSPQATAAAIETLEKGGNAIDATIAAAFTLGVIDSQSSGIGGMTHMLIHLESGQTIAVDGTSHAPATIDFDAFREFKESGRIYGYETIAVPTTLATLEYARARYGTLPLAELLQPAIHAAENGYPLSGIQIQKTKKYYAEIMQSSPYMRSLILENGRTIGKPGDRQRQPDQGKLLRRISAEGTQSFYRGDIADEIEADMIQGGGFLRKSDLAEVRIRETQPMHTTYRGHDVYSFPPPGGGATVIAILNILENFPSAFLAADVTERHHVFLEAFRIAAADSYLTTEDRRRLIGKDLQGKGFARTRTWLMTPGKMTPKEKLRDPTAPECQRSGENTTQISIADSRGNVVSLTQTLSRSFGAKVATPGLGFPYNSFLELFNVDNPRCPGYLKPKSPITSDMAPTIVLKDGELLVALGSPGSNMIPPLIAQIISNMVDRGMDVHDAVTAPRVLWGGLPTSKAYIEIFDPITEADLDGLRDMGFSEFTELRYPPSGKVKPNDFGGVNAVAYDPGTGTYTGVGDPRRWGSAMGLKAVAPSE